MPFTLLPAVDIAGGRVRIARDRYAPVDPVEVALDLQANGAEWIHLVDLDAAYGQGSNRELLVDVVDALDIDVEIAGGVADAASLERALATGCRRVCLSTAALAELRWCQEVVARHGDRVAVSLDVRLTGGPIASAPHRLVARGLGQDVGELWPVLAALNTAGCHRVVVTDVGRDGALAGIDAEFYALVAGATSACVVASGGVSTIDDIEALVALARENPTLDSVIVGAALHASRFSLADAFAAVRGRG